MADRGGAQARLETAVKRLELAINHMAERTRRDAGDEEPLQIELNNLSLNLSESQAENNRLSEQLAQAKKEYTDLQSIMDKISERLDSAIDTAQALLEEQPGT